MRTCGGLDLGLQTASWNEHVPHGQCGCWGRSGEQHTGSALILVGSPVPAGSGFPGEISASPDSCPHALPESQSAGLGYTILIFTKLSDSKRQPCWRIIGMRYPEARVLLLPLTGGLPSVPQGTSTPGLRPLREPLPPWTAQSSLCAIEADGSSSKNH